MVARAATSTCLALALGAILGCGTSSQEPTRRAGPAGGAATPGSSEERVGPAAAPADTPAPPDAAVAAAQAVPTPDDCGRFVSKATLPPRHGCRSDGDCRWTARREGDCNPPLCSGHYRAGLAAWVEAVEALHERVCGDREPTHCERVRCLHRRPTGAVCREGQCEPAFDPETKQR